MTVYSDPFDHLMPQDVAARMSDMGQRLDGLDAFRTDLSARLDALERAQADALRDAQRATPPGLSHTEGR